LSSRKSGWNAVLLVMVITPLVVAPLVLVGVYLGLYVGGVVGYSKSILAIAFSTVGFLISMAILSKVITFVVARSGRTRTATAAGAS